MILALLESGCPAIFMYTYAFLRQPAAPLDLPEGIAESLHLVSEGGLAALVEPDLDFESLHQSDERLMRAVLHHDYVIREMFTQTAVLPLRFGTSFLSEQKLMEHLHSHAAEYLQKLSYLADKAEYTLKLTPAPIPESVIPAGITGKDYFLAKKQRLQLQVEQQQQQRTEFETVREAIAHTFDAVVGEPVEGVERIYLLMDRDAEPLLLDYLQTWKSLCPTWTFALSEAIPPYHFL